MKVRHVAFTAIVVLGAAAVALAVDLGTRTWDTGWRTFERVMFQGLR